jgi:hypothetical protein
MALALAHESPLSLSRSKVVAAENVLRTLPKMVGMATFDSKAAASDSVR